MIDNTYTFQEIIGYGGSSRVFSATDNNMNKYAIKAIRKDKGYESEMESMMVLREYLVMEHIGEHPNIIKHFSCNPEGVLNLDNQCQSIGYNVMEYCENGTLASIIKNTGALEESIARFIFTQLSYAVQFLHEQNFCHLDIKLENTLLDGFFNVKLGDFGSGVSLVKTKGRTTHRVGTPLYMPTEIKSLKKGETYDGLKADIYSLGVTLCLMLLGEIPKEFHGENSSSTVGSSEMTDDEPMEDFESKKQYTGLDYLSCAGKDLLSMMMHEDPLQRPSIHQILAHEWLNCESLEGLQFEVYEEMQARVKSTINQINF